MFSFSFIDLALYFTKKLINTNRTMNKETNKLTLVFPPTNKFFRRVDVFILSNLFVNPMLSK